jgi:serine/threonine protein kinase
MLVMPGLVAAVGLFITWLGQSALRESTAQLGRDRFAEQTDFVARSVATNLAQTDPVLDRMRELVVGWSPSDPAGPIAHALRGLIQGRAGLAYVSVSYPDGTFQAAYLSDDGAIRFQEVRRAGSGAEMSRFDLLGGDALSLHTREASSYDPRTREFYRLAVERGRRVWTPPYAFFGSHHTGVTRAEAVWDAADSGRLRAVLTADLDLQALSVAMAHAPIEGARTLLYAKDGTLLAYPEGGLAIARLATQHDRPLLLRDLHDPVIDAFFQQVHRSGKRGGRFQTFVAHGAATLAMVAAVPGLPELGWNVAAIVPEATFFRARVVHERQSLIAAAVALLIALGSAVVFARHVSRVRRDAALARELARKATARAKELGSYRLLERLAQGAMGEVWRAEHRLLVRQAAVKLIRPEILSGAHRPPEELRERFRREAQTLATLRSRHTSELFDYGVTEDGTFFFVMELLDGMDLDSLVERHGPQPPGRVIHWMLQACSSLAEAHDAGLVHRDIKPANIFVCRAADEFDVVKVLDFGIVQASRSSTMAPVDLARSHAEGARLTAAGQHMGTPACMAPEQAQGKPTDGRADLYGLACVAVWLLSGRMLFEYGTALGTMIAHVAEPVPDLTKLVAGELPPSLNDILLQCLSKSPDDRPKDARALAAQLRSVRFASDDEWTIERARAWWNQYMPRPAQP